MRRDGPYLGTLCRNGHDHLGSGMSMRHASGHCAACVKLAVSRRHEESPEKAQKEKDRQKAASIKKRKGDSRQRSTPERKRMLGRGYKAKARKLSPEKVRANSRAYYEKNSVRVSLRNRVYRALKQQGIKKVRGPGSFTVDLGAISRHLGPCPGPRSEWHIDHIRPLASFDLSDQEQLRAAFSPENHQWLPAKENLMKSCKYA